MRIGPILLLAALVSGLTTSGPLSSRRMAGPPIPTGWKLDATAIGDLTGDAVSDTAVVVRQDNPKLVRSNDGLGSPQLDTNPRQLLVFERTPQGFRQIAAATKLVPPAGSLDTPCLDDPLAEGGISIAKQVLSLNLHYWLSCGSWGVASNKFHFKRQGTRFLLIGFDRMEFMRNSGLGEEVSVNFLTNRKSTTPFAIDDSIPKRLRWSRIKPQRYFLESLDLVSGCPQVDARTYLC